MKPDYVDGINVENNGNTEEQEDSASGIVVKGSEKYEKRHESFPLDSIGEEQLGEYVMKLPKRFRKFWVVKFYKTNYFEGIKDILIRSIRNRDKKPIRDYRFLLDILLGYEYRAPLFGTLNINSQDEDICSACKLLDMIMADGDIHQNNFWRVVVDECYIFTKSDMVVWYSFLKSQIPVRLMDECQMPNIRLPKVQNRKEGEGTDKTMECLGVYQPVEDNKKEIWLCIKRIRECAEKEGISFVNLFIIVYLHELAHAAFDPSVEAIEELTDNKESEYHLRFDEHRGKRFLLTNSYYPSAFTMEESLANALMLKYLESFVKVNPRLLEDAKRFVNSQTLEYKFGIKQFEVGVDCTKWRDYKSKNNYPDEKLINWYDQCFDKENYTKDMYDEVFK